MPNELTPARLRELIAAANPHGIKAYPIDTPYTFLDLSGPGGRLRQVDAQLIIYLVNNAPALADAREKAELLEWAIANGHLLKYDRGNESYFGMDIHELRAAKEASE